MALFIWGSGHKSLRIEFKDSTPCATCKSMVGSVAVIDYDYSHIFWLFKGLKNEVIAVECWVCGATKGIDKRGQAALFRVLGRNPIPFMDRYGAHVLLAIFVAYIVLAFFVAVLDQSEF